ncbi:SAM-dependent methyltransferase, partial [Streptomyces albogriseolus]
MTGQNPVEIDTTRPHPARMYDWYLGGKDNYPVDEAMGRQMLALAGGCLRPVLLQMLGGRDDGHLLH